MVATYYKVCFVVYRYWLLGQVTAPVPIFCQISKNMYEQLSHESTNSTLFQLYRKSAGYMLQCRKIFQAPDFV